MTLGLSVHRIVSCTMPFPASHRSHNHLTFPHPTVEHAPQPLPPGVGPAPIATQGGPRPPTAPHPHAYGPPGAAHGMSMYGGPPGMGMRGPRPPYGGPHQGMMAPRPMMQPGAYPGVPPGMPMQAQYAGMYGAPQYQFVGQQQHGGVRCAHCRVLGVTHSAPAWLAARLRRTPVCACVLSPHCCARPIRRQLSFLPSKQAALWPPRAAAPPVCCSPSSPTRRPPAARPPPPRQARRGQPDHGHGRGHPPAR